MISLVGKHRPEDDKHRNRNQMDDDDWYKYHRQQPEPSPGDSRTFDALLLVVRHRMQGTVAGNTFVIFDYD